jgi:hypothetical protein
MAGMLTLSSRNLPQNVLRLTSKVFEIKSFQVNNILIVNVRYNLIYMFQTAHSIIYFEVGESTTTYRLC